MLCTAAAAAADPNGRGSPLTDAVHPNGRRAETVVLWQMLLIQMIAMPLGQGDDPSDSELRVSVPRVVLPR